MLPIETGIITHRMLWTSPIDDKSNGYMADPSITGTTCHAETMIFARDYFGSQTWESLSIDGSGMFSNYMTKKGGFSFF